MFQGDFDPNVIMSIFSKITGDPNEKVLKKLEPLVSQINELEKDIEKLSDSELKEKTSEFKKRLKDKETLDDILPEAFSVVREAAKRSLGQRHYDVQLVGGIVLHQGKIAEMKTGEGKTLVATLPLYLNSLEGNGCHIITPNDYLSRIGGGWMGPVYHALGVSVGIITNEISGIYDSDYEDVHDHGDERLMHWRTVTRKEAYEADVTYGTNNEFGFDYLRDNLAQNIKAKVQGSHNYAIVDEIDSILIDEARTPLIISAPDEASSELYGKFARIVPTLNEDKDYNVDYKMRTVSITDEGIDKVEKALGVKNIYDSTKGGGVRYVHNLEQTLKAHILFARDKNYVVKDGEVIIVDEFTGRLMKGRRYSEGLHQAIEAKEGVDVKEESRTLASITFQNYFRMYKKLSGMTGTALTSAEEFDRVYELEIVAIPTNKPMIRDDMPDFVFRTEEGKLKALVKDLKERHKTGQPILIGTTSIEKNEYLSKFLQKEGISHEILNAKNHEREGSIISQAGVLGVVTVATNMAGRGVDIILGGSPLNEENANAVKKLGGLHVIGTERHEARRIDNQLRGRAGRQGDMGSSQFYLSLEDEIMKVFGGEKIQNLMKTLKLPEDQPIESKLVSNAIENAQGKIEGFNFDSRKRLLEYDEVLNKHRETIYKKRNKILSASDVELKEMIESYIESFFEKFFTVHLSGEYAEGWDMEELFEELKTVTTFESSFYEGLRGISKEKLSSTEVREKIQKTILEKLMSIYAEKEEKLGGDAMRGVERWVMIRTIDMLWMDHLDALAHMRDSVRLRAYAQRDPLIEYKNEGLGMFKILLNGVESGIVHTFFKIDANVTHHHHNHEGHHHKQQEGQSLLRGGTVPPQKVEIGKNGIKIGRNDPCPCGSGKKYKKCGLINSPEHKG